MLYYVKIMLQYVQIGVLKIFISSVFFGNFTEGKFLSTLLILFYETDISIQ